MEKSFYNDHDDFEDFIKQKSDQYKMYPSDKVWNNINSSLHTRRKWFIVGMFTLITGILLIAGKELIAPAPISPHLISKKNIETNESKTAISKKIPEVSITTNFDEFRPNTPLPKFPEKNNYTSIDEPIVNALTVPDILDSKLLASNIIPESISGNTEIEGKEISTHPINNELVSIIANKNSSSTNTGSITDDNENSPNSLLKNATTQNKTDIEHTAILQNTAPYQLPTPKKLNRKYWQVYATPTINYRKLSGEEVYPNAKTATVQSLPPIAIPTQFSSPNQYTNNKPALGVELGGSFVYRFTRNLSFKVGLQFDYSRYSIIAYASNPQPTTIRLNSLNGYQVNTITSVSTIGTVGGKANVNLQNQYFQISAPIGFELRVMGNEKLQLHLGASLQPTYLLNRDAYLLSSDYTSYIQEPSLVRKWNANGALEAFLSYKIGKVRWQIGPQFRYQLFSTYTSQYPISENLKEFGFKVGLTKSIW